MATRKLIVEIIGDSRSLERTYGRIETRQQKFQRRLKTSAKAGLIGAAAVGTAVVVKQLEASVKAAQEAEKATFRLRDAFKSAAATQKQYVEAQKEISRVSKESALDDEDLSDSLARLTRTTGSARKGLKGMALAANIARARSITLAAATNIVEKANVGQLRGLKAVGVQVDENTTAAEALDRAQKKFAGSARDFGKTSAASQERLGVAFENLQETIGVKLLPLLRRLEVRLTKIIESVEKNWPQIEEVIKTTVAVVKPVIDALIRQVEGVANVIAGVVKTIKAIANGDWAAAWEGIKQIALDGMLEIVKGALQLPAKIVKALGSFAWDKLRQIGTSIKDAALGGLEGLGDAIVSAVREAINRLVKLLNSAIGKLNKVPILPDIPKIPEIGGGQTTGRRGGPRQATAIGGERFVKPVVVVHSTVEIDGEAVGRATRKSGERAVRRNPRQKRGPRAGV